jgi:transcriptional regulator with XRE-family HTH domain
MRKLSQADLAELADMSVPYISHIETALKKPSLESVVKIADALGVTVDQLLNGNQSNDHHTYEAEVAELLADCNSKERRMIFELVTLVKRCLRENSWFFHDGTMV